MTTQLKPDLSIEQPAKRRRRFRRDPTFRSATSRAGKLELRRRDLDMIASIAAHRFMNTQQVRRLFACDCPRVEKIGVRAGQPATITVKQHRPQCACTCGVRSGKREHTATCPALFKDDQHVASRLRELYQAGFLERPVAQLQLRVKNGVVAEGSVPMVYCVTKDGLDIIGDDRRAAIGFSKLSWATKINEGTRVFIEHTLATADVGVAVDCSVRRDPRLERLSEQALLAGMKDDRRLSPRPFALKVRYKGEELSTICDLAFAVGDTVQRKRWNVLVEVDMGHMPVERVDLTRTSIMRKLIGYAKAYEERQHQIEFGWKSFRVLILTTSQERVRSCIKAARQRFGSANVARIFLFGTLNDETDILQRDFLDVEGKSVRLIGELA